MPKAPTLGLGTSLSERLFPYYLTYPTSTHYPSPSHPPIFPIPGQMKQYGL